MASEVLNVLPQREASHDREAARVPASEVAFGAGNNSRDSGRLRSWPINEDACVPASDPVVRRRARCADPGATADAVARTTDSVEHEPLALVVDRLGPVAYLGRARRHRPRRGMRWRKDVVEARRDGRSGPRR